MLKLIKVIFILIVIFIIIPIGILSHMFKGYSPGIGYDKKIAYENKVFDKYKKDLRIANENYFKIYDPYYFFEKTVKEELIKECMDRYFKENNISDVSGWRYTINENLSYINSNKLDSGFVDKKFTKSNRFLVSKGYEWTSFQHTYKITKQLDCTKSIQSLLPPFLKDYKVYYKRQYPNKKKFVDYLNEH